MDLTPDFERLRTALLCQGEPDHVPFVDAGVYEGHKTQVLGRPVRGLPDEIEFSRRIGYDFVPLKTGLHLTPVFINAVQQTHPAGDGLIQPSGSAQPVERRWVTGLAGPISTEADFEAFEWPDPDRFDYSVFAEADASLPSNMKGMCILGKVFNPVWWLMGFEKFCITLADNPGLIERLFEKVGRIQYRALERALAFRCVGVYWHSDDLAFNTSLLVSPDVLRKYAFPWFRRMVDLAHDHGVPVVFHSET